MHYIWSPTVHITRKCNSFSKYNKAKYLFSSAVYSSLVTSISLQSSTG
ncbi:unnamed protein product [Staurois parvus]|uniref:Uncharacterized protein n=1 Tax=Staurois parvus TaxID=386267 RepID=A0ABN9G790_9NEOB|nr:unnamed protein product [Staurois parvus]